MLRSHFSLTALILASTFGSVACSHSDAAKADGASNDITESSTPTCQIAWESSLVDVTLSDGTESGVVTGDFNGDGVDDFIVVRATSLQVIAGSKTDAPKALAAASVGFDESDETVSPLALSNIVTGDFNGDGKLDIVGQASFKSKAANAAADQTEVRLIQLRGAGNGTFAAPSVILTSDESMETKVADFDGDARADIVIRSSAGTVIAYGRTSGAFDSMPTSIPGISDAAPVLLIGDIDGDKLPDIAIVGPHPVDLRGAVIYQNQASKRDFNQAPVTNVSWASVGGQSGDTVLADVNGDGHADFLVADRVLRRFVAPTDGMGYTTPDTVEASAREIQNIADFDGDGKVDALLRTTGTKTLIACNIGETAFEPTAAVVGTITGKRAFGDFNGDGRQDIVVVGDTPIGSLNILFTRAAVEQHATGATGEEPTTPASASISDDDATIPSKSPKARPNTSEERSSVTTTPATAEASSNDTTGGCSTAPGTSSPFGGWAVVVGAALGLGAMRRKKR